MKDYNAALKNTAPKYRSGDIIRWTVGDMVTYFLHFSLSCVNQPASLLSRPLQSLTSCIRLLRGRPLLRTPYSDVRLSPSTLSQSQSECGTGSCRVRLGFPIETKCISLGLWFTCSAWGSPSPRLAQGCSRGDEAAHVAGLLIGSGDHTRYLHLMQRHNRYSTECDITFIINYVTNNN